MKRGGYEDIQCNLGPLDWRGELRGVTIFMALVLGPGLAAYLAIRVWFWLGNELLIYMAPDEVPREIALSVTYAWLLLIGLGLIAAAGWDGLRQWWRGRK